MSASVPESLFLCRKVDDNLPGRMSSFSKSSSEIRAVCIPFSSIFSSNFSSAGSSVKNAVSAYAMLSYYSCMSRLGVLTGESLSHDIESHSSAGIVLAAGTANWTLFSIFLLALVDENVSCLIILLPIRRAYFLFFSERFRSGVLELLPFKSIEVLLAPELLS